MEKQKIKINRKAICKEKEFEIKSDIIVPDIKPDMVAIKETNANTYIYKEEISRGKIRIDGNIDGFVSYLAENGDNRSLEITLDFSEIIEDDNITENLKSKIKISLKDVETKILNERKICVIANLKIEVEFYEIIDIEFIDSTCFDTFKTYSKSVIENSKRAFIDTEIMVNIKE